MAPVEIKLAVLFSQEGLEIQDFSLQAPNL